MPYLTSKPVRRGTTYEKIEFDFIVTEPVECGDKEYILENGAWIDSNGKTVSLETQESIQGKWMKLFRKKHPEYDTSYITIRFVEDYSKYEPVIPKEAEHVGNRIKQFRAAVETAERDRECGTRNLIFYGTYNKGFTRFEQELFFKGYGIRDSEY